MPVKLLTPDATAVKDRFVRAYEELRYRRLVTTKKEYCEIVGISGASNLNRMETSDVCEPTITQICLLLNKFKVSPYWLMLGKGEFIVKENQKSTDFDTNHFENVYR